MSAEDWIEIIALIVLSGFAAFVFFGLMGFAAFVFFGGISCG